MILSRGISAEVVVSVVKLLKINSTPNYRRILINTFEGWNALNCFKSSDEFNQIKYLLDNLVLDLQDDLLEKLLLGTNDKGDNLLHILSRNYDLLLLNHFLESTCLNINNEQFLNEFITSKTRDGNNFLHIVSSRDCDYLIKFLNWVLKRCGINTVVDLVTETVSDGSNLLFTVVRYNAQDFIKFVKWLESRERQATRKALRHKNYAKENFPQVMVKHNNPEILVPALTSLNQNIKDKRLLGDLISSRNAQGDSICHQMALRNPNVFFDILQMAELDQSLTEKIFFISGSNNETVLDKICNDIDVFQDTLITITTKHGYLFTQSILYNEDDKGNTILLKIFQKNEMHQVIDLLDWVYDELKEAFIQHWFQKRNLDKMNFIYKISFDIQIDLFIEWVCKKLNKEFIKDITQDDMVRRWSFFSLLAMYNNQTSFIKILKTMIDLVGTTLVSELLQKKAEKGWTLLHTFCSYNYKTPLNEVIDLFFNHFEDTIVEDLLTCRTTSGWTFLHHVCRYNTVIDIVKFIEYLHEKVKESVFAKILLSKLNAGWSFLDFLSQYNDTVPFSKLFELLFKVLNKEQMEELLTHTNCHGWSVLHLLTYYNKKTFLLDVLNLLLENLQKTFFFNLLTSKNREEQTAFHFICKLKGKDPSDIILDWCKNNFGETFIIDLLTTKVKIDSFRLITLSRQNKSWRILWFIEYLVNFFDETDIKDTLLAVDENNDTCMTLLGNYNHSTLIQLLVWISRHYGNDFLTHILNWKNNQQQSILDILAASENEKLMNQVTDFLSDDKKINLNDTDHFKNHKTRFAHKTFSYE